MDSYDNNPKEHLHARIQSYANHPDLFAGVNNITVTKVGEDCAEGELTVTEHSLNVHGIVHGGCLATLADTVAGSAAASRGHPCVTLNYGMNFLAPAVGTKIKCIATPEKVGRTVCVYHCLLTDDNGTHVATGNFTFFIVAKDRFRHDK